MLHVSFHPHDDSLRKVLLLPHVTEEAVEAKGEELTGSGSRRQQVAERASVGLGTLEHPRVSRLPPGLALLCLPPSVLPAAWHWCSQSGNLESGHLGS